MISNNTNNSSWFTKFSLSFLAIVGAINSVLFIIAPLLPPKLKPYIEPVGVSILALSIPFSFAFSWYWHYKEKNSMFDSQKYHTWLTTLLRYWMALLISLFGFEKIINVNFAFSFHVDDSLASALTGQELTWKYYGYSYALSFIIALFQLVGSVLLLFRRTILPGVTILLPVMFNIVMINLFYHIGPITCFTSIVITLGLSYLLFLRKDDIIALFSQYKPTFPSVGNNLLRIVARFFCILIPCLSILYFNYNVRQSEKYFGKWKVETMMRNGTAISERAWEKDNLDWKTIYIEERGKMYCCPNPYVYVDSTSIYMNYTFDVKKNSFNVISYEHDPRHPDTIPVQISNYTSRSMQWNMIFYKDTIQMQLNKVNE